VFVFRLWSNITLSVDINVPPDDSYVNNTLPWQIRILNKQFVALFQSVFSTHTKNDGETDWNLKFLSGILGEKLENIIRNVEKRWYFGQPWNINQDARVVIRVRELVYGRHTDRLPRQQKVLVKNKLLLLKVRHPDRSEIFHGMKYLTVWNIWTPISELYTGKALWEHT